MIQILKQRKYFSTKKNKIEYPMTFTKQRIGVKNIVDLFAKLDTIIESIPEDERWNLHYTLGECDDSVRKPRVFKKQNTIAFDIDELDVSKIDSYIPLVLRAIGNLNFSDVAVVSSGRGLHFIIGTTEYFGGPNYFKETKKYYDFIASKIDRQLALADLPGKTDRGIWSLSHTLRLPGTKNVKNHETGYDGLDYVGECKPLQRNITLLPVTIESLAGGTEFPEDQGHVKVASTFVGGSYSVDSTGILNECEFLKWCRDNQEQVKEPQWYAMLSIVAHLKDGEKLCHQFSENHPGYSHQETSEKIDQALTCAGPRTCENINSLWDGCKGCKHYKKVTSPITIKTKSFIKTRSTGFRSIKVEKKGVDKEGKPIYKEVPGPIVYEDLRKFFEEKHAYVSTKEAMVYTFNGEKWEYMEDTVIKAFCQDNVFPAPNEAHRKEFVKLIHATNIIDKDWFLESTFKRLNLKNGVLDLRNGKPELLGHSKKFGFLSRLDYEYNPAAKAPLFTRFLEDVTCNRPELAKVLMEFAGYAFSNDECTHEKALILLGEGSNGKSTFLETLIKLAGEENISALSMKDLGDPTSRNQLQGKLFNLAEETPTRSFIDSSDFKNIVTGGRTMVRVLYKGVFPMKTRAKLMMAANELPRSTDYSHGFFRRLLLVPFEACFSAKDGTRDRNMKKKLVDELPGILNMILEGYYRLEAQEDFTRSEIVDQAVEDYRDSIDPVRSFIKSRLEIQDNYVNDKEGVDFDRIYKEYVNYLEDGGYKFSMEAPLFSRNLTRYIPELKDRKFRKGKYKKVFYRGIRFAAWDDSF